MIQLKENMFQFYKGSWVQILVREGFSLTEKTIFQDESKTGFELQCWDTLIRHTLIKWVIKVPTENDMVYLIHASWFMITAMMVAGLTFKGKGVKTVVPIMGLAGWINRLKHRLINKKIEIWNSSPCF